MKTYFHQETGTCCWVYALCNALVYYGKRPPKPDTPKWDRLEHIAMCKHGSAIGIHAVAQELKLEVRKIKPESFVYKKPAILSVFPPDGCFHAVLAIDGKYKTRREPDWVTLTNYRTDGPTVETIDWNDLKMPQPGNINRRAYYIKYTGVKGPKIIMCDHCNTWWYKGSIYRKEWHMPDCPNYTGDKTIKRIYKKHKKKISYEELQKELKND